MNILTNWENFTDEELKQIKESLESETQKRKEKPIIIAINDFLNAFRKLKEMGIVVSVDDVIGMTLYEEDFYFKSKDGGKYYDNY